MIDILKFDVINSLMEDHWGELWWTIESAIGEQTKGSFSIEEIDGSGLHLRIEIRQCSCCPSETEYGYISWDKIREHIINRGEK